MAIARRLVAQGHDVQIVCASAIAPPADLNVAVLANQALTNHGINVCFSRALRRHVGNAFDVVAGFDALEGLDVLYCANPPVRMCGFLDRINPRQHGLLKLERACFNPRSATHLLLLSEGQRRDFDRRWALDPARVTMIPATIERSRVIPHEERRIIRARLRAEFGLSEKSPVWLFVGSFPQTKGLDRVIGAMTKFPSAHLLCVSAEDSGLPPFRTLATQAGLESRISWLGARDDVPALMVASDILVHPARLDITGTVILEALVNGLPVIATDVCGYAGHIAASGAGHVLRSPFETDAFLAALRQANTSNFGEWSCHAGDYAATTDLFSGLDVAAAAIIRAGQNLARHDVRQSEVGR